jgi:predicted permease
MIIAFFILLMVGFVAGKVKIIDAVASKKLSALIIKIGQPALIINSLIKMEYSAKNLSLGLQTLVFGFAVHIFMAAIAFVAFLKIKNVDHRKLTEFSAIFANVGFLGMPILKSLFGDEGEFMGAFFIVSFNVFLWTWGIMILARKRDDIKLTPRKIFVNFGSVPSIIGFILFIIPAFLPSFALPQFITTSISYVGSLCTPVSTMIIGALLSTRTVKQIFGSGKVYYLCVFKLIIIPLLVCGIMKLMGFDEMWILFGTAITAMPSATAVSMQAELYDISPGYSAQCVGTSSLLSVATMPCVIMLAEMIAKI